MTEPLVTVAIATHNRLQDLKNTLERLKAFEPSICGVLVCADGCIDGTQAFLRDSHPDIVLFENNPGLGSIPSRNKMIRSADSPYVLLLDDDSYPLEPDFFQRCQAVMEQHPEIGVLTFPQRSDEFPESLTREDFGPNQQVGTFTSSGSIIRRELFLKLGGFPDFFFHAYEEPDYALRVHANGYHTVQWNELSVRHHYTQAMRDEGRTHRRHARNEMWSTIMRAPFPLVLGLIPYRIFSQGKYAFKRGFKWVLNEPRWWGQAACGAIAAVKHRNAVSREAYHSWVELIRSPRDFR